MGKKIEHFRVDLRRIYEQLYMIVKRELIAALTVLWMLIPGMLLDAVYYKIIKCTFVSNGFRLMSELTGITYQSALEKLDGMIGALMTMVSLFLATSINLAQRRDDNLYGIPRYEFDQEDIKYTNTRRVSYVAPLLIIIFLNLSMCITGYLLYLYCFAFYFLHYRMHEQSYNEERNKKLVVKKLVDPYLKTDLEEGLLSVQVFFERIGDNVDKSHHWSEPGILYKNIMNELPENDLKRRYALSNVFFDSVYFGRGRIHELEAIEFIREFVAAFDKKEHSSFSDSEWVELFAILEVAIMKMGEENLNIVLSWLDNFTWRNKILQEKSRKNSDCSRQVDSETKKRQRTMLCVLLECRLQCADTEKRSLLMAKMAAKCWYDINTASYFSQLAVYSDFSLHRPRINLQMIIDNLINDYNERTKRSAIAYIASIASDSKIYEY